MSDEYTDRKQAGPHAYVDRYEKPGDRGHGYSIHCRLCQLEERRWSTRTALKHVFGIGKRTPSGDSWINVMNAWKLHMQVHHPEVEPPEWGLPRDLSPRCVERETAIFEPTEEDLLLDRIYGPKARK